MKIVELEGRLLFQELNIDGMAIMAQSKYKSLVKTIEELQAENEELQKKYDMLMNSNIVIKERYDKLDDNYDLLNKACIRVQAQNDLLQEQMQEERNVNNKLLVSLGALYERLETVKRAHYLAGYSDGAYNTKNFSLNDNCRQLKKDVAEFPALLDRALTDIKNLLDKQE